MLDEGKHNWEDAANSKKELEFKQGKLEGSFIWKEKDKVLMLDLMVNRLRKDGAGEVRTLENWDVKLGSFKDAGKLVSKVMSKNSRI